MNGLIKQWGNFFPRATRKTLILPLSYSSENSYSFVNGSADGYNSGTDTEGFDFTDGINKKTSNSVDLSIGGTDRCVNWLTIGY